MNKSLLLSLSALLLAAGSMSAKWFKVHNETGMTLYAHIYCNAGDTTPKTISTIDKNNRDYGIGDSIAWCNPIQKIGFGVVSGTPTRFIYRNGDNDVEVNVTADVILKIDGSAADVTGTATYQTYPYNRGY